ncbi:hypothetical protein RDWZM_005515 [Blomia tropicalis]|uniref:Uncharacterized protein n=1 Tax=Blomia tropicalis TaxID=40697 RepID=A0A9Q0M6X4_BLOTA|nr:hypothetical protein RDWZM_005515 [Blomia tropicalis]
MASKQVKKRKRRKRRKSRSKKNSNGPLIIKSNKGAAVGLNNIPEGLGETAKIAPDDYFHIYNAEKVNKDPIALEKVKQNLAAGVGLKVGSSPLNKETPPSPAPPIIEAKDPPKEPIVDPNNIPFDPNQPGMATKAIAPEDYVQIFVKDANVVPGVNTLQKAVNDVILKNVQQ